MTLNYTRETLTDSGTGYIYDLTVLKDIDLDFGTSLQTITFAIGETELHKSATCLNTRLGKMTCLGLDNATSTTTAHRDLQRIVAIGIDGFHLRDTIGLNLYNSHWDSDTIFCEDACHAAFATNNTYCHYSDLNSAPITIDQC
jgi:hypothetical protein